MSPEGCWLSWRADFGRVHWLFRGDREPSLKTALPWCSDRDSRISFWIAFQLLLELYDRIGISFIDLTETPGAMIDQGDKIRLVEVGMVRGPVSNSGWPHGSKMWNIFWKEGHPLPMAWKFLAISFEWYFAKPKRMNEAWWFWCSSVTPRVRSRQVNTSSSPCTRLSDLIYEINHDYCIALFRPQGHWQA